MSVIHRPTVVDWCNSTPCGFCGKPYLEHIDPPTQQACETDCLGSRCNFKPVVTDPERERLRVACQAALAWIENMSPTVRRTALANQLRAALGDK